MRVNVYTEELLTGELDQPFAEIVTAEYISSRTGQPMTNYGLRIFMKSAPELHYIPGRDDDRSAVTFWCGPSKKNIPAFLETVQLAIEEWKRRDWSDKVDEANRQALFNTRDPIAEAQAEMKHAVDTFGGPIPSLKVGDKVTTDRGEEFKIDTVLEGGDPNRWA